MSNLPCGVTDAMCDGNDPSCGNCGHLFSDHYYEDGDEPIYEQKPLNAEQDHESHQIEYDAYGERVHGCDCTWGKTQEDKIRNQCDCTGFSDEPYEPDWDNYRDD